MEDDLEMEGPEKIRTTTRKVKKVVRPIRLPTEIMAKVRQLAAINGLSLSDVATRLIASGLSPDDYPQQRKGWIVYIKDPEEETAVSRYFIPEDLDQTIEDMVARGYSSRLVLQSAIEQGLINAARRQHSKNLKAVDAGQVAPVPDEGPDAGEPQVDPPVPDPSEGGS